jgi:hypothetical protein
MAHGIDRDRLTFASQLAFLRACPEVISRLLKKGGNVLLPAKVLVISRLLHKKLSKHTQAAQFIGVLRDRLAFLRRSLLTRIDQLLGNPHLSKDGVLDAMCAFSLATSSSAADVLRHFHHVRGEVITARRPVAGEMKLDILEALQCWAQTLSDTRTMFPKQLASLLSKLRTTPILEDPAIYSIDELDCETHVRWVGDEIKRFTPYIIHDNLQAQAVSSNLAAWTSNTFQAFISKLDNSLTLLDDFPALERVRDDCISLLLSNRNYITGIHREEIFNLLRDAFLQGFIRLVNLRCNRLAQITTKIVNVFSPNEPSTPKQIESFWKRSLDEMLASSELNGLTRSLNDNLHAHSSELRSTMLSYREWVNSITEIVASIKRLRESKWLEEIYDYDDDEETMDSIRSALNEHDPSAIQNEMRQFLRRSFETLQSKISLSMKDSMGEVDSEQKAAFLLRILRQIQQEMPKTDTSFNLDTDLLLDIHSCISKFVLRSTLDLNYTTITKTITSRSSEIRALWDGNPELPIFPSVWMMKLLKSLHLSMAALGNDLWSPAAVKMVRSMLRASLANIVRDLHSSFEPINGDEQNPHKVLPTDELDANGTIVNGDNKQQGGQLQGEEDDTRAQLLFDIAYIGAITLGPEDAAPDDVLEVQARSLELETKLAATSVERVKLNAVEYWKRTCSLYSLLN